VKTVKISFGGESWDFPMGVTVLLYGSVATGKTTFSLLLAREFLSANLPVIWVCLDESPKNVRDKMEYFKIDYEAAQSRNLLKLIDIYSEQITGKSLGDERIINVSSAFNLNEINRAMMRALKETEGEGIVVFDSVSTLLLYNRSGTCEEFLKVHMSRITSHGYTGLFILQRDLHEPQIEETLKMMSDSVLEFAFKGDERKISHQKIPLGTGGEWINSSIFQWEKPENMTASSHRRQYDGGLGEGLMEGIRQGLSNVKLSSTPASGAGFGATMASDYPGRASEGGKNLNGEGGDFGRSLGANRSGSMLDAGTGASGKQSGGNEASGAGLGGGQSRGEPNTSGPGSSAKPSGAGGSGRPALDLRGGSTPSQNDGGASPGGQATIQHIDRQIIVANMDGLSRQLREDLRGILGEQVRLSRQLDEGDSRKKEGQRMLHVLETREKKAKEQVERFSERSKEINRLLSAKNQELAGLREQKKKLEEKRKEILAKQAQIKEKAGKILESKKLLESKIHSMVSGSPDLHIDLTPYIGQALAKTEEEASRVMGEAQDLETRINAAENELSLLNTQLQDSLKVRQEKGQELEVVKDKKEKIKSELTYITEARNETKSRLQEILYNKEKLESRLREVLEAKDNG
jgi:KaiC/GvpD/RAD55 family RecA-like ATPase